MAKIYNENSGKSRKITSDMKPKDETVQFLLSFSKQYRVVKTKEVLVELNLN